MCSVVMKDFPLLEESFVNVLHFLEVYLQDLDSGDKTVVTENIDFLSLGGRMYEDSASLRFFLRQSSSLLFNDFYATTPISLINVQDVNNLKVIDSGFESVAIAEFIRVTSCQNDDKLCRKTPKVPNYLDNLEITRINAPFSSRNLVLSFFRCSNCWSVKFSES